MVLSTPWKAIPGIAAWKTATISALHLCMDLVFYYINKRRSTISLNISVLVLQTRLVS